MATRQDLIDAVEALQNNLIAQATSGGSNDAEYVEQRRELLANAEIAARLPRFVRTCRNLSQFWSYIQPKFPTYKERREFIWSEFAPVIEWLESGVETPSSNVVRETLSTLDSNHVNEAWRIALNRRNSDPSGAITASRTLLESVCKLILEEEGVDYGKNPDLPKLYSLTATCLNLAANQHAEHLFKQILGGCQTVVEGLGAVRNRLGDSHGQGKNALKPAPRHAELAVNLAGSMATFLVATWESRRGSPT